MPPALFFSLKSALAIQAFYDSTQILGLLYFCEKCHWKCDRDCIESVDCFGWYGHV